MRLSHAPVRVLLALLAAGCAARSSAAPTRPVAGRDDRSAPITAATPWRCIDDPAAALRASRSCGVAPGDSIGILRSLIGDPRFLRADPYEWTTSGPTIAQAAGGDDWLFVASVAPDSSAIDDQGAMAAVIGDSAPRPIAFARRRIATDRARIDVLSWSRRFPSRATWIDATRSLGTEALATGTLLSCLAGRSALGDRIWSLEIGRRDELIVVGARLGGGSDGEPTRLVLETVRAPRSRAVTPVADTAFARQADAASCRAALERLLASTPIPGPR